MLGFAALPLLFLTYWFYTAPLAILRFFLSLNTAYFQLFSVPLMLKTFFQPIKNEYRQGLVGVSIGMGMVVKSVIILVACLLFIALFLCEIALFLSFLLIPFVSVALLFRKL